MTNATALQDLLAKVETALDLMEPRADFLFQREAG